MNCDFKKDNIVGVLNISNKINYGLNSRKNPYFLFNPLNKEYPNFLVSINDKTYLRQNKKILVVIKYSKEGKKLNYGSIIKIIGNVNDYTNDIKSLLYKYKINTKTKKVKLEDNINITNNMSVEEKEYIQNNYNDMRDIYTISIDPKRCLDIDDAISYRKINDNDEELCVHIADVSYWVEKLNIWKMLEQPFTIYFPNKNYNIFPQNLSENIMSLRAKQERLVLTFKIIFSDNEIVKTEFQRSLIKVDRNMTYEKANNLITAQDNDNVIKRMFSLSKLLPFEVDLTKYDSHNMIENLMIYTNNMCAKHLLNNPNSIIRTHDTPNYNYDFNKIRFTELDKFLRIYQMDAAKYVKINETDNFEHYGLGLGVYTHFTSPIRRIVDIYNHILIKDIIDKTNNGEKYKKYFNLDKINDTNKINKKIYRDLKMIDMKYKLQINPEYYGYIIDNKDDILIIYIPDLNYVYRHKINNHTMSNILSIMTNKDKIIIKDDTKYDNLLVLTKYIPIKLKTVKTNDNEIFFDLQDYSIRELLN
jgi:exoribonuclease R